MTRARLRSGLAVACLAVAVVLGWRFGLVLAAGREVRDFVPLRCPAPAGCEVRIDGRDFGPTGTRRPLAYLSRRRVYDVALVRGGVVVARDPAYRPAAGADFAAPGATP